MNILADSVEKLGQSDPSFRDVTVRTIVKQAQYARNVSVTYGGKTPMELKEGRRPPDLICSENMDLGQLDESVGKWEESQRGSEKSKMEVVADVVRKEAFKAHIEARQRIDIRQDLLARVTKAMEDTRPYNEGDSVWYWKRDPNKGRGCFCGQKHASHLRLIIMVK